MLVTLKLLSSDYCAYCCEIQFNIKFYTLYPAMGWKPGLGCGLGWQAIKSKYKHVYEVSRCQTLFQVVQFADTVVSTFHMVIFKGRSTP